MPDNIFEAPIFIVVSDREPGSGTGKETMIPKKLSSPAPPSASEMGRETGLGTAKSEEKGVFSHQPEL
jgi:hypothetical protein